ncbi:hypothetical protein [Cytobacillus firmus]|uniref:hypothetical protein n=1 Tax=Cytobacillus firmus TaxID=1399 RepID=UPI002163E58F|nr:hypothetical protein [Cytobacillus firmus]MCS0673064.1 hypothetical protein [Cytobacillus firmus]
MSFSIIKVILFILRQLADIISFTACVLKYSLLFYILFKFVKLKRNISATVSKKKF